MFAIDLQPFTEYVSTRLALKTTIASFDIVSLCKAVFDAIQDKVKEETGLVKFYDVQRHPEVENLELYTSDVMNAIEKHASAGGHDSSPVLKVRQISDMWRTLQEDTGLVMIRKDAATQESLLDMARL